jgi:hypothetical protein
MAFKDFFSKIFEEKKEKHEIKFEDINSELEKERGRITKEKERVKDAAESSVIKLVQRLKERAEKLRKINLEKVKEREQIKNTVREGLDSYAEQIQNLVEKLESAGDENYIEVVKNFFNNFEKASISSFERARILIGRELGDIKDALREFSKEFNEIIEENRKIFERERRVTYLESLAKRLEDEKKTGIDIKNSIKLLEEEQKRIAEGKMEKEIALENLKNSEEYKKIEEGREKRRREMEEFDRQIQTLKQEIDLRAVAKYFHGDRKKSELVRKYNENFKNALEEDTNLEISVIVKEARGREIEFSKLRERGIKLKETHISEVERKLESSEGEITKIKTKLADIKNEIEREKRKDERFKDKIKETEEELRDKIGSFFGAMIT